MLLLVGTSAPAFADVASKKKRADAAALVGLMPSSEVVIAFDSDRFLNDALPQILISNQPMYNDIMSKIEQIQKTSGIDLRQLDQLVIGLSARSANKGQIDFDPLMLARGKFNSDGLVAIVGLVSEGKFRQETIAGRTVYIFSPMKIDPKTNAQGNNVLSQVLDMFIAGIDREMALTAYDDKTLAVGATERVRDLLEKRTQVSAEIVTAVNQNPKAVLSFAGRMPEGIGEFIDLTNDNLGKTLSGIRFISGSMDMTAGDATLSVSARMDNTEQAAQMKDLLVGFQALFAGIMSGGKGKDKDILGRALKGIRITRTGTQVSMGVTVPRGDIATLVAAKK